MRTFLILFTIFLCEVVYSQPNEVNFQGLLKDSNGNKLNGTFLMTFNFYETKDANSPVYGFTPSSKVEVSNGVFNVDIDLGDQEIFKNNPELWLGIKVENEPEFPRIKIVSAGYAIHAKYADSLLNPSTDVACSGCVGSDDIGDGSVTGVKLATDSVDSSKIVDKSITLSDIGANGCTAGQVMKFNGTDWVCGDDEAGSGSVWNASGNNIYYNGGNVGIGTDSPVAKLDIKLSDSTTSPFQISALSQGFSYKRQIAIDNSSNSNNLVDYQVLITFDTQSLISAGKMRSDCGDIEFTDSDGVTTLNYWLEGGCNTTNTKVWVKVPLIPANASKNIYLVYGKPDAVSSSNGPAVFDPVSWESFKSGWKYSGVISGKVSGWEDPLTKYDYNVNGWSTVDISTDFVPDVNSSRWFVRKEFFIKSGSIVYSGVVDDDEVWTLIDSSGTYQKIGGNENDADGMYAHPWSNRPFSVTKDFGHYIWAGRGQEGGGSEFLKITSIDSGISNIFQRKIVSPAPGVTVGNEEQFNAGEVTKTIFYVQPQTGNVGVGTKNPTAKLEVNGDLKVNGKVYSPGTVVQVMVNTSSATSSINTTSFTEVNSDYRISITPKFANSKFLIEFYFSINTDMAKNTIFHFQIVRNIGSGSEVPVGVGPTNGSRNKTTYVSRPSNGYDGNDMKTVYLLAVDSGLTPGVTYTYGFKYRREQGGSGTCYFNYSKNDSSVYGFTGIMTMKITEIAQ